MYSMHKWIARDEFMECTQCGLLVDDVAFKAQTYPTQCDPEMSYCIDRDAIGMAHYLVHVPEGPDEMEHSECYYCAKQL